MLRLLIAELRFRDELSEVVLSPLLQSFIRAGNNNRSELFIDTYIDYLSAKAICSSLPELDLAN